MPALSARRVQRAGNEAGQGGLNVFSNIQGYARRPGPPRAAPEHPSCRRFGMPVAAPEHPSCRRFGMPVAAPAHPPCRCRPIGGRQQRQPIWPLIGRPSCVMRPVRPPARAWGLRRLASPPAYRLFRVAGHCV